MHLPQPDQDDPYFWRSLAFAGGLSTLVAFASTGRLGPLTMVMLGGTLLGFAVFFLAFPRGMHIAVAQATMQAVYMCVFVFFHQANFGRAQPWQIWVGYMLPVVAFLCGALAQRTRIGRLLAAERVRRVRFDHLLRWSAPVAIVGALSFVLPDIEPSATTEGWAFLAAMAAIALAVGLAARDVVLFILDTSLVFEAFFARIANLAVPAFAFLTFWTLLAVVFACLYRLADLTTEVPQFSIGGEARPIAFAEALYFSVVTLATVGYGDISPIQPLARMLTVAQIVSGLLLLIFGVNELIRYADNVPQHGGPAHNPAHKPPHHPPDHGHH
jgi:voltage-gated potassium channel